MKAVSEIERAGFTDHMIDSRVNEGAADADSKPSVLVSWVDGEDNAQEARGAALRWICRRKWVEKY